MRQEQIIKPNDPLKILVPGALAQAFGLNLQQSNELVVPSFADKENVIDKSIKPKTLAALETIQKSTKKEALEELFVDGNDTDIEMPDFMPDCDQELKERGNISPSEDLSPIYFKSLEQIKEEQLSTIHNGQNVLPFR